MRKKFLLKLVKYALILFAIGFAILLAIAFDVMQNERGEFPWYTFWVALMTAIGFTVGCVACAIMLIKNKRH